LPPFSRLLSFVRDADWLNERRARAYSLILLAVSAIGFVAWVVLAQHLVDRSGKPLGPDFMSFYAASKLALSGRAAQAWNPVTHQAAEDGIFRKPLGYWAFFYPPAYLLLCWPLAVLPYGMALLTWLGGTTTAAVAVLRRWAKGVPLVALLAFPALWLNLGNGQNAALFTAIMASGCLLLPRRPILAGLVFGLLVMKPQLAIAMPVLLAASGRWKTLAAAGFSAAALSGLAWLAVGTDGYLGFLHNGALAEATLDQGLVSPDKMQSLFAALRLLGGSSSVALVVQIVVALAVLGSAAWIVRGAIGLAGRDRLARRLSPLGKDGPARQFRLASVRARCRRQSASAADAPVGAHPLCLDRSPRGSAQRAFVERARQQFIHRQGRLNTGIVA